MLSLITALIASAAPVPPNTTVAAPLPLLQDDDQRRDELRAEAHEIERMIEELHERLGWIEREMEELDGHHDGHRGDLLREPPVAVDHLDRPGFSFFAGGVFVGTGCAPEIERAVVRNNAATYGAGVGAFAGSNATLSRSAVYENVAAEWGGGVLAYTQATLLLSNDTVVRDNEAQLGGGAHAPSPLRHDDEYTLAQCGACLS